MGRLEEIQGAVKSNFAEQFAKGFWLGQDMLDAIPPELNHWKRECGVSVVGSLIGYGVQIRTYKKSDFSLYGFLSLEHAAVSLSLLREAWRPYVDIIEVTRWEGDEEVTLKLGHAFTGM